MMLCDAAQVADGKLFILGGGWSLIGPDPMPSAIAIKVDVDWHEAGRPHHWELFLVDEDGRPIIVEGAEGPQPIEVRGDFEVARPEGVPEGSPVDVAVAVNFSPLPLDAQHPLHLAAHHRRRERERLAARLLDEAAARRPSAMTSHERPFGRVFEEFVVGDVYRHWPGKTITEYDDHLFCLLTMNHHPLHLDAWFGEHETVQGANVVVGNLVYSLALGMSVPDVSGSAIANLEVESLQHKHPTFHGDTIYAETRVLEAVESSYQARPRRRDRGDPGLQPARRRGVLLPPQADGVEARLRSRPGSDPTRCTTTESGRSRRRSQPARC